MDKVPEHIAIIMDGNGRWAKKNKKNRIVGHKSGVKTVKKIVEHSAKIGIKYLTLYTFSSENWNRPKLEIEALMTLLVVTVNEQLKDLLKNDVRLTIIGEYDKLPKKVYNKLNDAVKTTAKNKGLNLVLAINYGARQEIINAVKKIANKVSEKELEVKEIDDNLFNKYLDTKTIPAPELLIRTSGEYRLSNFLLWQVAYTEFYFTEKYWPEFDEQELDKAIIEFNKRERRFGKISEQINN